MQRPAFLLLLSIALGALAQLCNGPNADERLEGVAAELQERVNAKARRLAERLAHWQRTAESMGIDALRREHGAALAHEGEQEGLSYWAWADSALVLWSAASGIPEDSLSLANGGQFRTAHRISLHAQTSNTSPWHALAELWEIPVVRNRYLSPHFHPSLEVPRGVIAETSAGIGPVVRDTDGRVLFRLTWDTERLPFNGWDLLKALFLIAASLLLVAGCWVICMGLEQRSAYGVGQLVFIAELIGLRYLSMLVYPIAPFDRLELFGPQLYATSLTLPSLGDLLITAILLVVVTRFVHVAARGRTVNERGSALAIGAVGIIALLLGARWITQVLIGLVEDSSVDLDLHHIERINGYSAIALLSMALLFTAWLLLADTLARAAAQVGRVPHALWLVLLCSVGSLVVHHWYSVVDLILVLWPLPLLLVVLHGRRTHYRFAHAVVGLVALSFLSAHLLIKYAQNREQRERVLFAERMVTTDDPVVELLFRETAPRLRTDPQVYAALSDTASLTGAELDARVRQEYFTGYWERYDVHLYAFGTDGRARGANTSAPARSLEEQGPTFTRSLAAADMPDLHFHTDPGEPRFYHAQVAIMSADTSPPAQLIIELHPRPVSDGQGYPELLLNEERSSDRRALPYNIARYERGVLTGASNGSFPTAWPTDAPAGEQWSLDGNERRLAYGDPNGSLVVLSLPLPSALDKATTFSWLFAFLSALLTAAFVLRSLVRQRARPSLSIGNKVRVALLLFAAIGLLFFGIGAQRLLTGLYAERNDEALLEKTRSLVVELQHKLDGQEAVGMEQAAYLDRILGKFSNIFFTDINLYLPDGRLIATSRPQIFTAGLLGRRMHPAAFTRLALDGLNATVQVESIGKADYRSAYMPLRSNEGRLMALINLPSFARQTELEEERTNLLTTIVNLFVLLLALSLLAGVLISNWTTRPLEVLRRSIGAMALRGENEPIAYAGRDEIGELVSVYNRKVEELHASAEKLAASERESAWKEMARQVAHEIKNPLTPMKLGIQHFQRTWDPKAPDAKQKLDRFSASMVEQIDALSRVAGDFSRFAQMSAANATVLDLNDVAKNAVALFAGDPNADIALHPSAPLLVKADREHLLRVFNNLITNALQAIPEGRRGKVEVWLRAEGDHAIAEVRDNGSGIPTDVRDRIFEPSFTTKSSGMGLGLAMVKRMVEQASGEVRFESGEGQGTRFLVRLPLARTEG